MQTVDKNAVRPEISARYEDPLDLIWLHAARAMGMNVVRDPDVFASWDGNGTLRIGVPQSLDPDDCLAQMILHETCHALVEGPAAFQQADWGLCIDDPAQKYREHACLRLQAALTAPFGLRHFMAATTVFRKYYDQLPADPLADCEDPALGPARQGFQRAQSGPWAQVLTDALSATADLAAIAGQFAEPDSLWHTVGRRS